MALKVDDIRTYMKDVPELNILLEGELQTSDPGIALAMRLAISDFNSTPPVTSVGEDDFPNETILLYGALHHICNMEAERQLRNNVNYNAQGLNAGIDDKMPQYNQLATYYKQLFDSKLIEYKRFLNNQQAWGGEVSPYSAINQYNYGQ